MEAYSWSVCPFVNNLQWVSCERNSSYTVCQPFWNSSCSFRPIVLKLHRWLGYLLKICKWCPPNVLWKNGWIWIIFCIHTNFPLKQWSQGLSDTDYQLPIFLLKYHIPDRDIPNFLHCPFFLKTNPSISWIRQNRFFSIQIRTCMTYSQQVRHRFLRISCLIRVAELPPVWVRVVLGLLCVSCVCISQFMSATFPFGFEGRMWDLIVWVPDICLSF